MVKEKNTNIDNWTDKTILVVEDEPMTFKLINVVLSNTGVELLKAEDGLEAIDICKKNKNIDLILMDIGLPKMDGYQATEKIRELLPNIPIIAQTAYVMRTQKQKCYDVGCDSLLTKPYSSDDLKGAIRKFFKPEFFISKV